MKLFILLFIFIVVTCQAHQSPLRKRQIARQGDPEPDEPTLNEEVNEKFKKLARKYMVKLDPDLQAFLVPVIDKVDHLRTRNPYKRPPGPLENNHAYNPTMSQQYSNPTPTRFNNPALEQRNSFINPSRFTYPAILTRSPIHEPTQLQQVTQMDQAEADREARLAQADKEALSKLSEEDKKLLESTLTPSEREALLAQLEDGKLDDLLPREENRFGGSDLISGAAAQIGSSAGRYIGHKLAGTLGAKLGAAAGAYLGAAAASRLVKKTEVEFDIVSDDVEFIKPQEKEYKLNGSATYGFGAYNV